MKSRETYHRARYHIMNYLMSGCVMHLNKGGRPYCVGDEESAFIGGTFSSDATPIGALVKLGAAPPSKWYLAWLVEYQVSSQIGGRYLLESIEDGERVWWSNVDVRHLPMSVVDKHPEWRWTDRQFAFDDMWKKATKGTYLHYAMPVDFNDLEGSATVVLRKKFSDPPETMSKKFWKWRGVRLKELVAFANEAIENWPERVQQSLSTDGGSPTASEV